MKNRIKQKLFLILSIFFLGMNGYSTDLPNILLFIGDDMTWRDCQPYGNSDVITPNIQRLAEAGMCFDNMYTSTAMCAPTRQQLYTGIFPARSGAYPNHSEVYDGVKSLGHHFGDLGYRVVLIGKQHYGPDKSFPFEYLGGRQHDDGKNGPAIELNKLQPIVMDDRPFFIIVAQNQPHTPWNRGHPEKYDKEKISIPDYMIDCQETRELIVKYYAEITHADSTLGVCLDYIEEAKKTENTISIFTSEQGYSMPFGKWTCYDLGLKTGFIISWPKKVKQGTRNSAYTQYVDVVPTLLEMAGKNPEKYDVGIADQTGSRKFDGLSFIDVVLGKSEKHRDYVYGIQTTRGIISGSESYPIRSVRSSKYKYIQNISHQNIFYNTENTYKNGIYQIWLKETEGTEWADWVKKYMKRPFEELYDLENDPYEMNNLASNTTYYEIKKKLATELENWMIQQGDKGEETELKALERLAGDMGENWIGFLESQKEKLEK